MNLKTHNLLFFIVVSTVSIVLFYTTKMGKMLSISYSTNNGFNGFHANLVLTIYFFAFNLIVHRKNYLKAILFTLITAIISIVLAYLTFGLIMNYLHYIDQQRTPLGWSFNYQWFLMIFLCVYFIFSIEFINKKLRK